MVIQLNHITQIPQDIVLSHITLNKKSLSIKDRLFYS